MFWEKEYNTQLIKEQQLIEKDKKKDEMMAIQVDEKVQIDKSQMELVLARFRRVFGEVEQDGSEEVDVDK